MVTWRSRLGDNLASRWSGRGSTSGWGNFISLFWPFWFCLFVCLFVCFRHLLAGFSLFILPLFSHSKWTMPKKNRKRNEIYQVDQWRSLKTEKSLGTTLQSGFLPGIFQESFCRLDSSVFNLRAQCSDWKRSYSQATLLGELQLLTHLLWFKVNVEIIYLSF